MPVTLFKASNKAKNNKHTFDLWNNTIYDSLLWLLSCKSSPIKMGLCLIPIFTSANLCNKHISDNSDDMNMENQSQHN